ncbi:orotidine-5'-phosphate decarboxylase [Saccharospirillum mangrovi]|uniref:orotidine-5'-phosphate decarboxylase n=1 Tax=Saccharospirillum mangrovi TaxID=2161747 RepID=UPI000D3B58C2|nr:orotidine-5'-phosphate decarboxylase [Saccharospirillum mangrovi]
MTFIDQLQARWQAGTQLCVGLDPFRERFPARFQQHKDGIEQFNNAIVDATADLVCAFKPQFAHHAAESAEAQLKASIGYIKQQYPNVPVILDAKRGDIGSTAAMYAREAFEHYGADAVTVNPYMGADTVLPFAEHRDKGVIVLCRTSNPSARDFQDQLIDGEPLYIHVARRAQDAWNGNGNLCLVVGATAPEEMARIRAAAPDLPLLVPGIGAQGGDLAATVRYGQTAPGRGLMINASRSVLYASEGDDFASAARQEALTLRDQIQALAFA